MKITDQDRDYYSSAVDFLSEKYEIAQEFVRHDGMTSVSMERMGDIMIKGIKEWAMSAAGETWLGTIGYYKQQTVTSSISGASVAACITVTGSALSLCHSFCNVCSGYHLEGFVSVCERCGQAICMSCANIVDESYDVIWCKDCLEAENLTNMLNSTV